MNRVKRSRMACAKNYAVKYLDGFGREHFEITPDIITFYQRVRSEGLSVIEVVATW